jgi:hypothetical protein
MLTHLKPSTFNLFRKDAKGNNCFHYAVIRPKLSMMKYLAQLISIAAAKAVLSRSSTISTKIHRHFSNGKPEVVNTHLASGWLYKKHSQRSKWMKRWVTLSTQALYYSKHQGNVGAIDYFPLDKKHAIYSRATRYAENSVTLILIKGTVSSVKKRTQVVFRAENEDVLQVWLTQLAKTIPMANLRTVHPCLCSHIDICKSELEDVNAYGETPLHILAKRSSESFDRLDAEKRLNFLAASLWLVENGCSLITQDKSGNTAYSLSVKNGLTELSKTLQCSYKLIYNRNPEILYKPRVLGFTYLSLNLRAYGPIAR